MVVRQNGEYYGLFTFVEDTDDEYLMVGVPSHPPPVVIPPPLQRHSLPPSLGDCRLF